MKKIISALLTVVILWNFIFCSGAEAKSKIDMTETPEGGGDSTAVEEALDGENMEEMMSTGNVMLNGAKTAISMPWNVIGAVVSILVRFLNLFPMLTRQLMTICISGQAFGSIGGADYFTIERAVFNQIAVFNVDFFNLSNPYQYTLGNGENKITIKTKNSSKVENALRSNVAKFYYILRLIAMAISLLVLIYVGIRMALSTISSDKAKYKSMLISWVESIVILFLMQYIIAFILGVGNLFSDLVFDLKCFLDPRRSSKF